MQWGCNMKTFWQIFCNWNKEQVCTLRQHNIEIEEGCNSLTIDNDTYTTIKPLLDKWNVLANIGVRFTPKEVLNSEYSVLHRWKMIGYPMPDNNGGYLDITYNTQNLCSICGVGKVQNGDFRLKSITKKPFWGIGWIFDEFFVSIDAYNEIFKPLKIGCRKVRLFKSDCEIDSVVQLVLPEITEPLDLSNHSYQVCSKCGTIKYSAKTVGFFPLHSHPISHMYKSYEVFGDGCSAYKRVFVSKELRERLIKYNLLKITDFVPCY